MRAVLSGVPVRVVGRQVGLRCTGRGNVGLRGRGMSEIPPLLLVGCGRMGGAMLSGWRERGLAPSFAVDPAPDAGRNAGADLTVVSDLTGVPAGFAPAAVVFAVK